MFVAVGFILATSSISSFAVRSSDCTSIHCDVVNHPTKIASDSKSASIYSETQMSVNNYNNQSFHAHASKLPSGVSLDQGKATLPPPAVYDEQMGLTFAQNFTTLSYNVTAVQQNDSNGYGPAYLLNGLSDHGYWYQVGISWDWPFSTGGYTSGFNFNYEVFNSTGQSVFPGNASGGLTAFSGPVNQGDIIQLNLYISGGVVFMSAEDLNTSIIATQDYTAAGSSTFIGLSSSQNKFGFFTGLMTEQYHASPYGGPFLEVTYSDPSSAITSATMWIDEWDPSANQVVFSGASPEDPVHQSRFVPLLFFERCYRRIQRF